MGARSTDCLYSTLRNTSGVRRTFGFIPPHGKSLGIDEEVTVFGDVKQALIKTNRAQARRSIIAFERALQRDDITIVSTPNPIFTDDANPGADPQMLRLHNGTLGVTDPCWTTETSLSPPIG